MNTQNIVTTVAAAKNNYPIKLKHNAYIYNKNGKRKAKKTLKKGRTHTAYGKKIIRGKQYYKLSHGRYIKVSATNNIVKYVCNAPSNNYGRKFPGSIIEETSGAYKLRFAPKASNIGKSGSYRTIYVAVANSNVYFLDIYAKKIKLIFLTQIKHCLSLLLES